MFKSFKSCFENKLFEYLESDYNNVIGNVPIDILKGLDPKFKEDIRIYNVEISKILRSILKNTREIYGLSPIKWEEFYDSDVKIIIYPESQ